MGGIVYSSLIPSDDKISQEIKRYEIFKQKQMIIINQINHLKVKQKNNPLYGNVSESITDLKNILTMNLIRFRETETFLPSLFYYNITFNSEGDMFISPDFDMLEYGTISLPKRYINHSEIECMITILKTSLPDRLTLYKSKTNQRSILLNIVHVKIDEYECYCVQRVSSVKENSGTLFMEKKVLISLLSLLLRQ